MDLEYVKKLIEIFDESAASELKIEEEGLKIKISKKSAEKNGSAIVETPLERIEQSSSKSETEVVETPQKSEDEEDPAPEEDGHKVNSPIVGTFYRSPSPDSPPYVEVGDRINKGDVLCIVEAMKLMNEIESDVSGVVKKILVENAQPVEYSQPLFIIDAE